MLKYLLFLGFTFLMLIPQSYAAEKSYILQYARCNELLSSPYISHSIGFGEKKCIILVEEETQELILLSEKQDILESALIQESLLQELKTKYYRGEKLNVEYSGELKDISHPYIVGIYEGQRKEKILTPKGNYTLILKSDSDFLEKKVLSKYCRADSFLLTCDPGLYKEIQDRISTTFQDIFLRGDALFQKDEAFLNAEQQKIEKIRKLYKTLGEQYQDSEKILYLLESIDYKLSIYESIIKNTIHEKETERKILSEKQQMKGNYYTHLGDDIFIYTEKLYIYFYYGNTLVNTVQNDMSHFSNEEIQKLGISLENRSLLAYHIIQKYSLGEILNENLKDYRLIQKEWWNGPSSILINRASERYAIAGNPKNFIQSGNVLLSLVENKEGTDYALGIYKPKNNFTILYSIDVQNETEIEGYSLVGKQVELSVKTINGSIKKIVLNLPE